MERKQGTDTGRPQPDLANCRVRRLENGLLLCLMKPNCGYAVPFGNICGHPQADRIPLENG